MDSSDSDHPLSGIVRTIPLCLYVQHSFTYNSYNQDDTYFDDLTHPIIKDFEHKDWNTFANDLTITCASIFPVNPIRYHTVQVLLLNWALDDLGTEVELQALGNQFKSQFNFKTEFWKIPSHESENELEKKLSQIKGTLEGPGNLLIVYYGGHGKWDPRSRSIWTA